MLHSSSFSPLLPLLLLLLRSGGGAAEDAQCGGAFRSGQDDFMLDVEDAAAEGAGLLDAEQVHTVAECVRACCDDPRCNLAQLVPRAADQGEENRTCVLFSCLYRNRFVCRFVNRAEYRVSIRDSVFQKHLEGPQGSGDHAAPIANAGRDVIVQPGRTVTLNGIESLGLYGAQITSYQWSLQSGDASVTMEKTDLPDQVRLSNLQTGSYIFSLTVTDSNGQSADAKTTVLVLNPELSNLYCLASVKVGPCRAAFPRWRFNAVAGHCEKFVFGGCKPNKNNFLSENECLSACSGVTAASERLSTPTEVCGKVCAAGQLTCDSGCCVDRSVECDGMPHCSDASDERHCDKLNQTFTHLLSLPVNQSTARCTEPPHTGPCRASHTRWYYDPLSRKCDEFTFGGCQGNDNNFQSEQSCIQTCAGVTEHHVFAKGVFDRFDKDDDSDSGSIALAVVLSVAILALLAILTYCFLRARRERSRRPVATGPAHVTLSEQDSLVYNSTTKPV